MPTKKCCCCSRTKPLNAFYKDPRKPDGRRERCKDCTSEAATEYRARPEVRERLRERGRAYYAAHLERERARSRAKAERDRLSGAQRVRAAAWYEKNRERKLAAGAVWREANRPRMRALVLLKRYGITTAERDAMEVRQKGLCACCGRKRKLVVDHDHKTGKVRSLLCYLCNGIVGHKESHSAIDKLADAYLLKHS
jgi:hypothetical protein